MRDCVFYFPQRCVHTMGKLEPIEKMLYFTSQAINTMHRTSLKINSIRCFDNNLQNIFRTNIFESNATGHKLFIVVFMIDLCYIILMLAYGESLLRWCYLWWLSQIYLHLSCEECVVSTSRNCGPSHTSKMDLFARIINSSKLTLLTIFLRSSIVVCFCNWDSLQGMESQKD